MLPPVRHLERPVGPLRAWWFLLLAVVVNAAFTLLLIALAVGALSRGDGLPGPAGDSLLTITDAAYVLAVLALVVLVVLWALEGTRGPDRYGPSPA